MKKNNFYDKAAAEPVNEGRRRMIAATAVTGLAATVPFSLKAQEAWPKAKPIRIIIPFPPGNTMDVMSRMIAPKLSERLGTPVLVDNRDGAGGRVGMMALARSAPDGYTFGGGQGGTLVVQPHTSKALPYDVLKDFEPISLSTKNFLVIGGANNAPFTNIRELVSWARANPGKLTVGTNGEGGFPHLAFEDFCAQGKFTYTHVPYKGSAAIATDLSSGYIMACIDGVTGLTPTFQANNARLLAVTNDVKVKQWPNSATANEAVPGFTSNGWFGYIAPAGMPAQIVARLNQEINLAMGSPEFSDRLQTLGLTVVTESPQWFRQTILKDHKRYGDLVKSIGFEPR
jgi:tripartite-type tricarboxylate transporter receptor subunit TctC